MKFKLAFAIHNHQPVGNFNAVFDEAHQKCYLPFLELIHRYPDLRFSLHQSGILWDWQKQHHPEYYSLVGDMVDRNQVELLTGGYYEPIMPAIPDADKRGQIELLTEFIASHFEVTPQGMWLAERVWEPHLPAVLHDSGVRYLALDDTHFKYAGLNDDDLFGAYVTEEAGKTLLLLPILQKLRYLIPFGDPEDIIAFLRAAADRHPGGMAVYADDGEKFGIWPNTHNHCYRDRWLSRFFDALAANADWLEVVPLSDAVEQIEPIGRVYLPSASYNEMMHWALPVEGYAAYDDFERRLKETGLFDDFSRFVRGGHWRGFLTKYPEANLLHKKMLAVSGLYQAASRIEHVDGDELTRAREALYAGQCNCPYWHGVFGGLYLPHLRWAVYKKLVQAETILRRLADRVTYAEFDDYDRDGHTEIRLGNPDLSLVISPFDGGKILELDSVAAGVNLTDCLTRRREGYHQKLLDASTDADGQTTKSIHDEVRAKESGLEKLLAEDGYLRRPLVDHFLAADTTIDRFLAGSHTELGDFLSAPYESSFGENADAYQVTLTRRGHVWHGDYHCPLKVEKTIVLPKHGSRFTVEYRLLQNDIEIMPITFGVEFAFNLLAPEAEDRYAVIDNARPKKHWKLAALDETPQVSRIAYRDEYQRLAIEVESDKSARLWRLPIYTVSLSEGGFEKVFQGNGTLFIFDKSLSAGEELALTFNVYAGTLKGLTSVRPTGSAIARNM